MDIFISYAREDLQAASRLYHDLLTIPGVAPWLDTKNLLPGVRWKSEIMRALNTSDLVITLLSNNSVSKAGYVQKEVAEALERLATFPPDRAFLIPARLDDCRPRHPELDEIQWVDLFPEWDEGLSRITAAISRQLPPAEDAPRSPADLIAIEVIPSADAFERRLASRGELRGCDAMEIALSDLVLARSDLSGGNFVRCRFDSCDFRGSNLKGVNFEGATFNECRFAGANLWGVNFWGANLTRSVEIDKAVLDSTNFYRTAVPPRLESYVRENPGAVRLQDYDSFLRYFAKGKGMSQEEIARTFVWLNHRYFRMMLGGERGGSPRDPERIFRGGRLDRS